MGTVTREQTKLPRQLLPLLLTSIGSAAEMRALFSVLSGSARQEDRRDMMLKMRQTVRNGQAYPKGALKQVTQELYPLPPLMRQCPGIATWPERQGDHPLVRLFWSPVGRQTRLAGWLAQLRQMFKLELFDLISKGQYCGRLCVVADVAAEVFVIECLRLEGIPLWDHN